jgi:hypothetical protein
VPVVYVTLPIILDSIVIIVFFTILKNIYVSDSLRSNQNLISLFKDGDIGMGGFTG